MRYNRPIKVISIIVLFFFCWTFGGVFDIAYAIKNSEQLSANSYQQTKNSDQLSAISHQREKTKKSHERFQKSVDDIESILADTATDTETKKNKLRGKKSELESYDIEIREAFAKTEKKLKDEGLPPEILERHRNFVKHYEGNLNELKTNLDDIEKAKGKDEVKAKVERAKKFLEKVRPPKKHTPLDPNKLPHRTAEPVWIEPRTSPEEFLKDSSRYTVASSQGKTNRQKQIPEARQIPLSPPLLKGEVKGGIASIQSPTLAKGGERGFSNNDPILVASAGSLDGLLTRNPELETQNYIQIALADPPTSADLAETIEVKFTPAIQDKAAELGHNPTKIYNWVRNNIEFVPTYGSIQGADMCLQTKQCNAFDTASLLIALLRSSGIHSRYVYGTIELPIEKVKNWVGGFTDANAALTLIASGRIPLKGLTSGGKVISVQMEHVWVEAWIDYIPSRGEIHKQGDTWIPLDTSFKQYTYTQGIDIKSAVPFDAQAFIDQLKSTATINEMEGYVTNINSTYIQQTMTDYQTQVQTYVSQNYPNATVGDVLGKKEILKQEFSYLMGTLPYKMIVKGATYSNIPDSLRHKVTFIVNSDNIYYDPQPLNITKNLAEIAGKKITLSYAPATSSDEAVINLYLPKPHPDGTPIQPSELPSSLPAYLIHLKPELRIDSVVVASGGAIMTGEVEDFTINITPPNLSAQVINNKVKAGEYNAVAFDIQRISPDRLTALKTKIEQTKAMLEAQDFAGLTKDDILGDILYSTALNYFAELDAIDHITARCLGITITRLTSTGRFFMTLNVDWVFGVPLTVSTGSLSMDIGLIRSLLASLNGDNSKKKQFMMISGINSSALEHSLPEQLFSIPTNPAQGISAVKALKIANDQGIPIYTVNQSNIGIVLPQLLMDVDTKTDIANAVNAGKEVTVSKTNITFNDWIGCGYIIIDPNNGAGAYMISGGFNGSETKVDREYWNVMDTFFALLDLKNSILGTLIKSVIFERVLKVIGLKWILLEFVTDANKRLETASDDIVKKYCSLFVSLSTTTLAAVASFLPLGVSGGPLFTILVYNVTMVTLTFILNLIEEIALDAIRNAFLIITDYIYVRRGNYEEDLLLL